MLRAGVQHQNQTRKRADINVHQHPVTKCAGASPVNLLAQRIGHHHGDAKESDQPVSHASSAMFRQARRRNPRVASPQIAATAAINKATMPAMCRSFGERIALVNVASKRLVLIAED